MESVLSWTLSYRCRLPRAQSHHPRPHLPFDCSAHHRKRSPMIDGPWLARRCSEVVEGQQRPEQSCRTMCLHCPPPLPRRDGDGSRLPYHHARCDPEGYQAVQEDLGDARPEASEGRWFRQLEMVLRSWWLLWWA